MEDLIDAKRSEIAAGMKQLGQKLESGDDIEILFWVIPNVLACSHRPLRHHPHYGGSGSPISNEAKRLLLNLIKHVRLEGIKSIISLMHDRDLRCYRDIDFGEMDYVTFLKHEGF